MNICDGPLADVVRTLQTDFGWLCDPVSDGRAVLSSGRRFTDSEPVEVHVTVQHDIVVVSDGGEMTARLTAAGFNLGDPVDGAVWREALWEARLGFNGDAVLLHASLTTAADAAARLADALIGLDTLRLLAAPRTTRPRSFADTVEEYLRQQMGDDAVTRSPHVLVDGITVRPTLEVQGKKGPVYVQATATTAVTQAHEHAFYLFSVLDRGGVPKTRRLALLGGSEATWTRPRLDVLSEVAYVGLWSARRGVDDFLNGVTPHGAVLLPQS